MKRSLILLALAFNSVLFAAHPEHAIPGIVRFVVRTDPSWDRYTSDPSPKMRQWFRTNVWRMMVYTSYWDDKLSWYPNAWVYIDLYSIPVDSPDVARHPDWILRDAKGKPLYIPYDCKGGSCPQYAANVADPSYRAHWIEGARHLWRKGYKGFWVDDVNLAFRVSDGSGNDSAPVDRKTSHRMQDKEWKRDVAEFVEQIRAAFPNVEILHNAIWFAKGNDRDADDSIHRELAAADYINLERGVQDRGLTGGSGEWSLNAFFAHIDRIHSLGSGVVLDNLEGDPEYSLAAYFLISNGNDAMGDHDLKPDNWWPGLKVDLGDPLGPRENWHGLIRRRFSRGVALLNPPQSSPVRVSLLAPFRRADGSAAQSLTLKAADGVVLVGPGDKSKSLDSAIRVDGN